MIGSYEEERQNKNNKIQVVIACVSIVGLALGIYNQWYIQTFQTTSADELIMEGHISFDKKDFKKAVEKYDMALRVHESDSNAWRSKGLALFNLGIGNESVKINRHRAYSYAKELIDYYNLSYQSTDVNQEYLERALASFMKAYDYNPEDLEALLYIGIINLYLPSSPNSVPAKWFDELITKINRLPIYVQEKPPVNSIKDYAQYGKCVSFLKMGQKEKAEGCFGKTNETK